MGRLRAGVSRRCPMGGGAAGGRRFLGVVTGAQAVLHDVVDADLFSTVSSYLLNLEEHHLLATGVFSSDADVLCWLTNPLTREAVVSSCENQVGGAAAAGRPGWLAVVNGSSSAVFEMSRTGLSSAVAVMASAGAGVSLVRQSSSAAGAMSWLSTSRAADILSILAAETGTESEVPTTLFSSRSSPGCSAPACAQAGSSLSGNVEATKLRQVTSTASLAEACSSCCSPNADCGCSGRAPITSTAAPEADVWAPASAARASSHALLSRDDPPPLPLPFYPAKKRKMDLAAPSRAESRPHVSRSSPSAGPGTRDVVKFSAVDSLPSSGRQLGTAGFVTGHFVPTRSGERTKGSAADRGIERPPGPVGRPARGFAAVCGADRHSQGDGSSLSTRSSPELRRSGPVRARSSVQVGTSASSGADELPMPATRHRQPLPLGPLSAQAATGKWGPLFERMAVAQACTFVSGGPGVGKTAFLRGFSSVLRKHLPADGAVVICAPMGSSAHSAAGVTYHSFFGFPKEYACLESCASREAARLLRQRKYAPVRRRLAQVRVLLLDEISMIPADRLDVMVELIEQSRGESAAPCTFYVFGDFLQLRSSVGDWAFKARCWQRLFGSNVLELTKVHRQHQLDYIAAIQDARFGVYSPALKKLMDARQVSPESYKAIETTTLHLVPTHAKVLSHNSMCLARLSPAGGPRRSVAVDSVALDRDLDVVGCMQDAENQLLSVSTRSRDAALADCLAPAVVPHCLHARVMYTSNAKLALGLFHGCIGFITAYQSDGTAVVRFANVRLPMGTRLTEVYDAGDDWVEVCCPPVDYECRMYSHKGVVAVRKQVPFVLGWAITIHRAQSLTLTEAVLDIEAAFEAGMVHTAVSRVSNSSNVYVKSFNPLRLFADPAVVKMYLETWVRV